MFFVFNFNRMSEKSDFVCSFCKKILKNPINLPCFDIICEHHLKEASVLKAKSIKCSTCKVTFNLDTHTFVPNRQLNNLLVKKQFLSDEEKDLKKSLERSLQDFFKLSENYHHAKNALDLKTYEHFQEIRFQLDLRREKLIEKIDEVYLNMIEQTKKIEASFSNNSLKNLENIDILKTSHSSTLKEEIEELNESFRDTNLSTNKIKEKYKKHQEANAKIKSKLNEMSQIEEHLKASNEFKSNEESVINQDFFGSLKLNGFLSNAFYLIKLIITFFFNFLY
jgi:hypothetical protein